MESIGTSLKDCSRWKLQQTIWMYKQGRAKRGSIYSFIGDTAQKEGTGVDRMIDTGLCGTLLKILKLLYQRGHELKAK